MLGTPDRGWVSFQIGKDAYQLSYLSDIPMEWLDRAVFGMESAMAFQVEGYCEPGMLKCTVEKSNCRLAYSADGKNCAPESAVADMDMLQFCRELHEDIGRNLDAWSRWVSVRWDISEKEKERIYAVRKREITTKLQRLEIQLKEQESACRE